MRVEKANAILNPLPQWFERLVIHEGFVVTKRVTFSVERKVRSIYGQVSRVQELDLKSQANKGVRS